MTQTHAPVQDDLAVPVRDAIRELSPAHAHELRDAVAVRLRISADDDAWTQLDSDVERVLADMVSDGDVEHLGGGIYATPAETSDITSSGALIAVLSVAATSVLVAALLLV